MNPKNPARQLLAAIKAAGIEQGFRVHVTEEWIEVRDLRARPCLTSKGGRPIGSRLLFAKFKLSKRAERRMVEWARGCILAAARLMMRTKAQRAQLPLLARQLKKATLPELATMAQMLAAAGLS